MKKIREKQEEINRLRQHLDDLEENLITAKRQWSRSANTLQNLIEERKRYNYRINQFEEIMEKSGLMDGYDPNELYLVLLLNRKRILKNKQGETT